MGDDITAEQLIELLADDEMIEGGYDREGMITLLLLARAALEVQARELAELRRVLDGRLTVWATWRDGEQLPGDYGLSDPDGDPIDVDLDASELIEETRRRQAKGWVEQHSDGEGPELGALLSLVPDEWELQERHFSGIQCATWTRQGSARYHYAEAPTREAAIRAATMRLLEAGR